MLDPYLRPVCAPLLQRLAGSFHRHGLSANHLTFVAFVMGIGAVLCLMHGFFWVGLVFFWGSRLFDGLDGTLAQQTKRTSFGGFIDILSDFIIYSGVVFAFTVFDPVNAPAGAFLLFSFIGPMTSFLGFAILAAHRGLQTERCGPKSFYYSAGLCEGTETLLFLSLMCLSPSAFQGIAYLFGGLCWITTVGRFCLTWSVSASIDDIK